MKRLVIGCVAVLFLFSLYADSGEGEVTLTLQARVAGSLYHGFSTTDSTNSNMARQNITGDNVGDLTSDNLDLESDDPQSVGFYNILTTGASQAEVVFTATPMSATLGGITYYVPYLLEYEKSHGTGNVTVSGETLGEALVATTVNPGTTSASILTTASSGLRWATVALEITFAGSANQAFGLPESDAYSGTIVASIITE